MNPNLIVSTESKPLPEVRPEDVGIPPQAFIDFIDHFESRMICMHSFIAIRNGKICAEGYWNPISKNWLHRMYSSTKSFVALAIGYMLDEGTINLNDRIVNYFDEYIPADTEISPYLSRVTIENMLEMSTCHQSTTYKKVGYPDWARSFFTVEPTHLPGFLYSYDTSATHVLGRLVEKLSGVSLVEFLRPRLFDKIGVSEEAFCLTDPSGTSQGGSGLMLTTRDFAKSALACMQYGQYNGEQVIPEWFMRDGASKLISNYMNASVDQRQGYGYMFWRMRNNGFGLFGMGNQIAVCLPDEDFVLVTTGDSQWNANAAAEVFDNVWLHIYPHLSNKEIPRDDSAYQALQSKIDSMVILPVPGNNVGPMSATVTGRTYKMDENAMGITDITFTFYGDLERGAMEFKNATGHHRLEFGIHQHIEQAEFPGYPYGCITSGAWKDDNTFDIVSYIIDEQYAALGMSICFRGREITVQMKNTAESWTYMPFMTEYSGFASGILQ